MGLEFADAALKFFAQHELVIGLVLHHVPDTDKLAVRRQTDEILFDAIAP